MIEEKRFRRTELVGRIAFFMALFAALSFLTTCIEQQKIEDRLDQNRQETLTNRERTVEEHEQTQHLIEDLKRQLAEERLK